MSNHPRILALAVVVALPTLALGSGAALSREPAASPDPSDVSSSQTSPPAASPANFAVVSGRLEAELPAESIAPTDLMTTISREPDGRARVSIRRPGHLVLLMIGEQREAGQGSVSILLDDLATLSSEPLRWETVDRGSLAVARGVVRISMGEGPALSAHASLVDASPPAATLSSDLHRCAAYTDGAGGFSVLCELKVGAWRVGAANVTGADPRSGVWVIDEAPEGGPVVNHATGLVIKGEVYARLSIPLAVGGAEARILGYLSGAKGIVVRAEATRLVGEEPAVTLSAASRDQVVNFFRGIPMPPPRLHRSVLDDPFF